MFGGDGAARRGDSLANDLVAPNSCAGINTTGSVLKRLGRANWYYYFPPRCRASHMIKLVALHKHWCIADAVRAVVDVPIMKPEQELETIKRYGQEFALFGQSASVVSRMSVWYALLYVVIEGYRDLKQEFAPLDALLSQEQYVNLLRLFRNAIFHYQENPLDEKVIGFLEKEDSEKWIRELNRQFQAFFRTVLPIAETLQRLERRSE